MTTREERLAQFIVEMRAKYPHQPDWHWQDIAERSQLQWKIDDLREGIAWLVGAYGFRMEQQPENADLTELVKDLGELLNTGQLKTAACDPGR